MGLFSSIGDALNSITGAKSSSKDSHKYATAQQKLSFEQQKKLNEQAYAEQEKLLKMQQAYDTEMANTAIQRQMNDYLQTGINPAMVVGGSGAGGGSVSAPSTSGGSSGGAGGVGGAGSGIDILGTMINAYSAKNQKDIQDEQNRIAEQNALTSGERDKAQADYYKALQAKVLAENDFIPEEKRANIANKTANTAKATQETKESAERTEQTKGGIASKIFGTNDKNSKGKAILGLVASALPFAKFYKAGKTAITAKKFGNFIKSIR